MSSKDNPGIQGYTQSWWNLKNDLKLTVEQAAVNCGIKLDSEDFELFKDYWELVLAFDPKIYQEEDSPNVLDTNRVKKKVVIAYDWFGLMSYSICEPGGLPFDYDYPEFKSHCIPMCLIKGAYDYEEFVKDNPLIWQPQEKK